MKATTHELLSLNELIRVQSTEVQKLQAMLPMIAEADLRSEIQSCIQSGTSHVKQLVDFVKTSQVAH